MKTGDVVRDSTGQSYQVGQLLGRGLWGKSYVVRNETSGDEFVLKSALTQNDFQGDVAAADEVLAACRDALLEQGRLLEEARWPFLPRLHARFTTADGTPVLLLPKYTTTLEKRIQDGSSLSAVLEALNQVGGLLRLLADGPGYHGNLRPSNILMNERGDIFLSDLTTRATRMYVGRFHAISSEPNSYLPPEIASNLGESAFSPVADTYALGMILYRAILSPPGGAHGAKGNPEALPARGLDKAMLLALKDRVQDHLSDQESNPRFHTRVGDRAAAVLNRAIALETSPSPPFRFNRLEDFIPRLAEVMSLIRPTIDSVGKLLLDRPPANDTFETGEPIKFSVAVAASPGVDNHEELSVGIALFDEETGDRMRTAECAYTADKHPSGRFRFAFVLPDLTPGQYMARVAFAIRDSGHPPTTSEASFNVRAAAGYVPEQRQPGPQALAFERVDAPIDAEPDPESEEKTVPGLVDDEADTLPNEALPTPKPIAPSALAPASNDFQEIADPSPVSEPPAEPTTPVFGEFEVTEDGQEPVEHAVGNQSWTELPLPQPIAKTSHSDTAPDPEDPPLPISRVEQLVELMKEDPYVAFMGAGILLIIFLLISLFVLGGKP